MASKFRVQCLRPGPMITDFQATVSGGLVAERFGFHTKEDGENFTEFEISERREKCHFDRSLDLHTGFV